MSIIPANFGKHLHELFGPVPSELEAPVDDDTETPHWAPRPSAVHQAGDLTPVGEVLVAAGLINDAELSAALIEQAREAKRGHWELLGDVLQRWGLITLTQLEDSLLLQARYQQHCHFEGRAHASVRSHTKRALDIGGALVGLGLTASVLPIIALAITMEDGGPVLFRQNRVGLHGQQFGILKFRTMVPDADRRKLSLTSDSAQFFSVKVDARVTRVGRVLRETLLDELPQFWNVLMGEMSLVGTRPPTLDEVWHYDERHWARLGVKAGMTGMWQACPDRHAKTFEDVVTLDLEYGQRWSLALDVIIIAKTIASAAQKLRHA